MGWTVYDYREPITDPKAECDRLCTWSNVDGSARVVASSLVGNVYYGAVERLEPNKAPRTFAAVFLIQRSPFGYKDMDESMGPCEAQCPLFILEKLTPLPEPEPKPCNTCEGTGKLCGPHIRADRHGADCYICDGTGKTERHKYARNWRAKCWARFGGEPQGFQQELFAA